MTVSVSAPRREKNGRKQRSNTKAAIDAANRAREEREKSTVLSQPHRMGSTDQKCATALGSFCLKHKLADELYRAGDEYGLLVRRWQMVIANIKPEGHKGSGIQREDIGHEEARKLSTRREAADAVLKQCLAYPWVRHICVDFPAQDIRELPPSATRVITYGLLSLAVHFGMMRKEIDD